MLERNRPVPQEQPWPAVGPFHVRPERKPARARFELTETWLQAERPLGLCAALLRYCVNRLRKIVDGHIIKYNLTLFAYLNLRGLWLLRHVAGQSNGPGVANQCSHGPADDPEVLPDSARCHLKIMLAPVIKAGYLDGEETIWTMIWTWTHIRIWEGFSVQSLSPINARFMLTARSLHVCRWD